MKVQTNVRAGKQNRGAVSSTAPESTVEVSKPEVPSVPVSRCAGI